MKSASVYLFERLRDVIEECGGYRTDHTDELLEELVEDVWSNEQSEYEP